MVEKNMPWSLMAPAWLIMLSMKEGIVRARRFTPVLAMRSSFGELKM
jgi:hypothetical protein